MSLFPIIQPQAADEPSELELYKEIQWDFINNVPVFQNDPVFVTGKEAVLVWAWKALHTKRFKHEIYTWDYGNDVESLIGQPFTDDLKQSEASRYIKECLLTNPYITDVTDVEVSFGDGILNIKCAISTVYGEARINV